jgi:hypothetical protein
MAFSLNCYISKFTTLSLDRRELQRIDFELSAVSPQMVPPLFDRGVATGVTSLGGRDHANHRRRSGTAHCRAGYD